MTLLVPVLLLLLLLLYNVLNKANGSSMKGGLFGVSNSLQAKAKAKAKGRGRAGAVAFPKAGSTKTHVAAG